MDVPPPSFAAPTQTFPASYYRLFMVYDARAPSTLVGSVVAATESADERNATVVVTCASPCPATGFPEQTITHMLGSRWAGEYEASKTTTRWGCDVGTGMAPGQTVSDPSCYVDTKGPDDKSFVTGKRTAIDGCYEGVRSKMVFVTAGLDEWTKVEAKPTVPADYVLSQQQSMLSSRKCKAATASSTGTRNIAASTASASVTGTGSKAVIGSTSPVQTGPSSAGSGSAAASQTSGAKKCVVLVSLLVGALAISVL